MKDKLKTSAEWHKGSNITIIDPDGWDRNNYDHSFNVEKITRKEYNKRIALSTIHFFPKKYLSKPPKQ